MKHKIKCIEPYFTDIKEGKKQFELRRNDRDYKCDDFIELRQFDPIKVEFSGDYLLIQITYLMLNPAYLKEGYCAFGFRLLEYGEG